MFLERISIRKPVTVSSCILMLVLFGLTAWSRLGLEAFPETESSHVTVTAVYPGANPAEIESEVAGDLEDAVGAIDGVQAMHTACMENVCRITLEFERDITLEEAREALAAAPGVKLVDDREAENAHDRFPMPIDTSDQDLIWVGRVRRDISNPEPNRGITFWCCGDQIRKGAATNAVQILRLLIG